MGQGLAPEPRLRLWPSFALGLARNYAFVPLLGGLRRRAPSLLGPAEARSK
jgi:hypothetical protein